VSALENLAAAKARAGGRANFERFIAGRRAGGSMSARPAMLAADVAEAVRQLGRLGGRPRGSLLATLRDRYSKACHDVDALLARLRLDHVAEMRRQ